eukprot:TRINITY_DN343_c0_g1_i12.p1 TRINITY_DN343_c0_g1~~TRINITY_DN343_c0_g1_i12.p1  ORF type:complete len:325 (-),score=73.03 TRINITY_DN343_c0_g1_i12:117-1091(-)
MCIRDRYQRRVHGENKKQQMSSSHTAKDALIDFLVGGTAGAVSKTVVAPLERVKLLLQTQDVNLKLNDRKYKGFADCFLRCVREEGTISLWRGNWANVLRYFPTQAFNFAFKERYQKFFCNYDPKVDPWKFFLGNLMAGGSAGASSMVFVYPLDFARTRLGVDIGKQANERQFRGLSDCLGQIYKSDGVVGLYRGFAISVFSIFIYRSLYFGCYDAGKAFIFKDKQHQSIIIRFLFAQFVTTFSEFLSYPFDTVRRRLMMQSGRSDQLYKGSIDCFARIQKEEGFKAFFKGNMSNIMRSVGSSMVLVLYDEFKRFVVPPKHKKA